MHTLILQIRSWEIKKENIAGNKANIRQKLEIVNNF